MLFSVINEINAKTNKDNEYNFSCFLTDDAGNRRVSVTGCYTPRKDSYTLDSSLNPVLVSEYSDYYYGISPLIDTYFIRQCISTHSLNTVKKLEGVISEHCNWFALHEWDKECLPAFAKYALLALSKKFCVRIKKPGEDFVSNVIGDPSEDELDCLRMSKYRRVCESDSYYFVSDERCGNLTIDEIYENMNNIELVSDKTLYSGVFFKALGIRKNSDLEKNDVISFIVDFERSTYFTTCLLDTYDTELPLLSKQEYCTLDAFIGFDDKLRERMMNSVVSNQDDLGKCLHIINNYLWQSSQVNQINVSGSIMTNDNYVLMGLRAKGNTDEGRFYPSCNGCAEIKDRNVSFYGNSIYEDFPTIGINDERIDFKSEISREAYEELQIEIPINGWRCLGLQLTSRHVDHLGNRRCHFNILYIQNTRWSLSDCVDSQRKANEAFENNRIVGLRLFSFKNRRDRLCKLLRNLISFILGFTKEITNSCFTIVAFILAIDQITLSSLTGWKSIAMFVFAVGSFVRTILLWNDCIRCYYKYKPNKKKLKLELCKNQREILRKKLKACLDGQFHPITFTAVYLHFLSHTEVTVLT